MSGQGDLPEGYVLDEAPGSVADGEDLTLGDVLRTAETPEAVLQEYIETALRATSEPVPGVTQVIVSDPLEMVQSIFLGDVGRSVGHSPMWVRFWRPDLRRGLMAVLHSPSSYGECDLLMVAHPGVLNRATLRALFRWCFYVGGWSRVVARVPVESGPPRKGSLGDLLRRAGFKHEGRARGGLPSGDAEIWAMTQHDALWVLPRSQRPAAPIRIEDIPPPSDLRLH